MFLVRFLLTALLLLPAAALAQSNPGFGDGAPLCANVPNPNCPGQTTSLNSAFAAKADWPGTPSAISLTSGPSVAVPQASTRFFVSVQDNGGGESSIVALCPRNGIFKNLFVQTSGNVGGAAQTAVFTWRVSAGSTAVTCTISSGASMCNDQAHSVACASGQSYDLQVVTSATTGSIIVGAGIEFDAQ